MVAFCSMLPGDNWARGNAIVFVFNTDAVSNSGYTGCRLPETLTVVSEKVT